MVDGTALYILLLVFPALMAFAGELDLVTMTIPNKVSIALVVGFLIAAVAVQMPLEQFGVHVAVGASMLAVTVALFAFGVLGGGDAKLLAAAGLWIGFDQLFGYMFYVAVLGGLLSLVLLAYRGILPPTWLLNQQWAMRLHGKKTGIPYGIAIGGAGLMVFPATTWFAAVAATV